MKIASLTAVNAAPLGMLYRAHIDGFTAHFATVDQLRTWANDLTARYSLRGKVLKIWKATWLAADGSGAQYAAIPSREIMVA